MDNKKILERYGHVDDNFNTFIPEYAVDKTSTP
jgi:hypothetical protein